MIDQLQRSRSPARRRHQKGGYDDRCMGRSRGGLTTKIHALVDAEGRPIHLLLTAGQAGDAPAGRELPPRLAPGGIMLAAKAYDTDAIRTETRSAADLPMCRLARSASASPSVPGSTPKEPRRTLLQQDQADAWTRQPLRPAP